MEYADTIGGLQFTTAEASMLADVIKSVRRAFTTSSDRDTPADSPQDQRPSEPERYTLITQPVRSEQHRVSKQQRRAIDRTKWNRSKSRSKSVTGEASISEAWTRHQERQSVWTEPDVLPQTRASSTPIEAGCLAPALLSRDSSDEAAQPEVPDFSISDLEGDLWPQTFISVPWS